MVRSRRLHYLFFALPMQWEDDYTLENTPLRRGLSRSPCARNTLNWGGGLTVPPDQGRNQQAVHPIGGPVPWLVWRPPSRLPQGVPTQHLNGPGTHQSIHRPRTLGKKPPSNASPFTLEMLADMHENFASSGLGPDTILAALALTVLKWVSSPVPAFLNGHKIITMINLTAIKETRGTIQQPSPSRFPLQKREPHAQNRTGSEQKYYPNDKVWDHLPFPVERAKWRRTPIHPQLLCGRKCFVAAILRIIGRFTRLVSETDTITPLSVYQCPAS